MSDLDEEIEKAHISFVPQVGGGGSSGKKKADPPVPTYNSGPAVGATAMPGFADLNSIHQPPNGYGVVPGAQPGFSPNHAFYQNPPPPPPPQSSYQQPNCGNGAYPLAQPMLGQPIYPQSQQQQQMMMMMQPAGPYMPPGSGMMMMAGPPAGGAMLLLVEESRDMDFRTPLCSSESVCGCLNAWFLPYCLGARQANMLKMLPHGAIRNGQSGGRYVHDAEAAERTNRTIGSFNPCCGMAFLLDIGRAAAAYFFPGIFGTYYLVNGLCVQTMQNRQQIRARFGIASAQFSDCCVSYWCTCCAINQQQQEMKLRGANPRLCAGDDGKPSPSRIN